MKKILPFLFLLICPPVNASSLLTLSAEDRLSNNTVSSFCEDGLGRIWMATKSGVNRFDGYDVDVFYHDPLNGNSIQSNLVNKVYRDEGGNIWIGNANGLAVYDHGLDDIRRVEISLKSVENIIQLSTDRYLLCSQSASVVYNSQTGDCKPFEPDGVPFVFYSAQERNDCFIFCTSAYNLEFITFSRDGSWSRKYGAIHFSHPIHGTLFDSEGNIWTDAFGKGLWKVDPVSRERTLVEVDGLPADRIECLCSDKEGRVWLGTKQGIQIYDSRNNSSYSVNSLMPGSWNSVKTDARTFFKDSNANIWIGTSYDGASCVLSKRGFFKNVKLRGAEKDNNSISSLGVSRSDSMLWIGARHGVYRMGIRDDAVEKVSDIQIVNSICFHPSYPNTVFAASSPEGIYSLDKKTGRGHVVCKKADISLMYPAGGGNIWVGSLSGLFLVNPVSGTVRNTGLFPGNTRQSVTALMTDSNGFLWVGCREGLYRSKIRDNYSLEDVSGPGMSDIMRVQSLLESSDGTIWIGTSDGLLSFKDGEIKGFVSDPALRARSITGLHEGKNADLWITTDKGLFCYNDNSGTCLSFYTSDGLPGNHFPDGCISTFGDDFCVGSNAISFFNPSLIYRDTVAVAPVVTALFIHNNPVHPGDGSGILEEPIGVAESVVIKHNQNAFSFQFACPDFAACGNNTFWYKMEGFDDEWIPSHNRTATYTNLPKGKYVFRVRSANTSGVICRKEVAIKVAVKPVWYKTDAFLILLLLAVALGTIKILDLIITRAEARNEEKIAAMKDTYEAKLRRAKIREYVTSDYVPTADEEKLILKLIGKIEESISEPGLSVESLASYMCMSRCNLHLKVKNISGVSPIDLIKKIRIEKACEMLRQGDIPLTDVAERAGFASVSYLCSAFKKATGRTPKEYSSGK